MIKVILAGKEVDYEDALNSMDDELRGQLHDQMVPCAAQTFLDAYAEAHREKFGEDFELDLRVM